METVKRIAASVKTRRTSQDNNPALVRNGNLTVETMAEHTSKNPRVEMLIKSTLLFQLLFSLIVWLSLRRPIGPSGVTWLYEEIDREWRDSLRTRNSGGVNHCWLRANTVWHSAKDNLFDGFESRLRGF